MSGADELFELESRIIAAAAGEWLDQIDELRRLLASKSPGVRAALAKLLAPKIDAAALAGLLDAYEFGLAEGVTQLEAEDVKAPRMPARETTQTSKGKRITKADAAAKMYGFGSVNHLKALAIDAKALGIVAGVAAAKPAPKKAPAKKAAPKVKPAASTKAPALPAMLTPVVGLERSAAEALKKARLLAKAGASDEMIVAPLSASRNEIKRTLVTTINEVANAGTTAVAVSADQDLVWVAERDACEHCLALQGDVVKAGKPFDVKATYAAAPLPSPDGGPMTKPPRHIGCRCQVELCFSREYAAALKREADRSILRGFSLPSESTKARVAAAERLLSKGVTAPKSVKAYAAKAVKAGKFPTRTVPSG